MKEVFSKESSSKPQCQRKNVVKVDILRYPNKRSFILSLDTCNQKVGSLTLLPPPLTHPVHTYTHCLFEFLRNSFYFSGSSLWVTVQNLPLKVWKKRGIVWFMLEMNSIKSLLLWVLIRQKMGFQMLLLRADLERRTSKGWVAVSLEFYHFPQDSRTHHHRCFPYEGHLFWND